MTKSRISLLGSLFVAGSLAAAGCGGGSGGGTGGKGDAGTGGKGVGGVTGTGGKTDGGTGGVTGTGGKTDGGTGGMTVDAHGDSGPCTSSFGAANRALFVFNNGADIGWTAGVEGDPAGWDLANNISVGGTSTDGDSCPGALSISIPFSPGSAMDASGQAQVALKYTGYYGNTLDWTGYAKMHMSVKVVSASTSTVNNIQSYVSLITANNMFPYLKADTGNLADSNWHRVVVDMSSQSPTNTKVNELGVRIQINVTSTTPPPVQVLVDDIWLEAAPPAPDAGPDVQPDLPPDVPTVDAQPDTTIPVDTGVDTTSG
jgi:hypothetical protein